MTMYWRKKSHVVEALRLTAPMTLQTESGLVTGQTGDWLVIDADGQPRFFTAENFQAAFEPADEDQWPTRLEHERRKSLPRVRSPKPAHASPTPNQEDHHD